MLEDQYLDLLRLVMYSGERRKNRMGTIDKSLFCNSLMIFPLCECDKKTIPLLTTKEMNYNAVLKELLWFLSGSTNSLDSHCKIWDANLSRENLDRIGFGNRIAGDLGPGYGFQWRHYGETYIDCNTKYAGIDQMQNLIDGIKADPFGRRHIVTAWNPSQVAEASLPPCHILFQCNVGPDQNDIDKPKFLDLAITQRSGDLPIGVPFNMASYATLAHIIAQQTGLIARKFSHVINNAHIYENQFPGCIEQIERQPFEMPYLQMPEIAPKSFADYRIEDFTLIDYKFHPRIKFPFST